MRHGIAFRSTPPGEPGQFSELMGLPINYEPRCTTIAEARGVWPFQRIDVGTAWFALPDRERHAVLLHEAQHCLKHHMLIRILGLPIMWLPAWRRVCERQELEADAFAASNGYGRDFLNLILRHRREHPDYYPSFWQRISNLKTEIERTERHERAA